MNFNVSINTDKAISFIKELEELICKYNLEWQKEVWFDGNIKISVMSLIEINVNKK